MIEARDAIVVLGAALANGRLTDVLEERIRVAAELFHAGAAPLVVATGGVTDGGRRAESEVMAEVLRARGVSNVLVETHSRTTRENALRTSELLGGRRRIWLVTQPFHRARAAWLFRRVGFDVQAWHIADSIEYRYRGRALRWRTREALAWVKAIALSITLPVRRQPDIDR